MVSNAASASAFVRLASLIVFNQSFDLFWMYPRCAVVSPEGVLYCPRVRWAVVQSVCLMGSAGPFGVESVIVGSIWFAGRMFAVPRSQVHAMM